MADETDEQQAGLKALETAGDAQPRDPSSAPVRRPYTAPRLRYLGKVAEVTFGMGGSVLDQPGHPAKGKKHG